MKFSKKSPKRNGYYWYRESKSHAARIVFISKLSNDDGYSMMFFNSNYYDPKFVGELSDEVWGDKINTP